MKIALLQSPLAWGDPRENLCHFDRKTAECGDCDLILLPEMFASGSMMVKKPAEIALADKEAVAAAYPGIEQKMLEWAKRQDALVMGSTVCREGGRYYNRLIAAFPEGYCRYYDKRHCFRMGGENEHFTPGERQLVFSFRGMRIAAFICYDLRFPVWCRNTADYDLAVFVANWPQSRSEVWKTLLKARAIENQSFVAGVNCVGKDGNGLVYSGDSLVIDARGAEIGSAPPGAEAIVRATLDVADLRRFRKKFPLLDDRDGFLFFLSLFAIIQTFVLI